jgi:hypothetical protein
MTYHHPIRVTFAGLFSIVVVVATTMVGAPPARADNVDRFCKELNPPAGRCVRCFAYNWVTGAPTAGCLCGPNTPDPQAACNLQCPPGTYVWCGPNNSGEVMCSCQPRGGGSDGDEP